MFQAKAGTTQSVGRPELMRATIWHGRRHGIKTDFSYDVLMVRVDAKALADKAWSMLRAVNRFGLLSVYAKDHGARTIGGLPSWLDQVKARSKSAKHITEIKLLTLPRVLGYTFKPVSFWFCFDRDQALRAVYCEVNNTFGETHTYICENEDLSEITGQDLISAQKLFHVSPFFERDGRYDFRFSYKNRRVVVRIDHYAPDGQLRLVTAVKAKVIANSDSKLTTLMSGFRALMVYPLIVRRALPLWWRKIPYVSKPIPFVQRISK